MRHLVVEVELAEPSIGKVKLDLLAQTAFRPDAIAVPDNKHPDHQFRIDRRAADVAVKGSQLLVQVGQHGGDEDVHSPYQVVLRNHIIEIELVEQLSLFPIPSTHHPRFLPTDPNQ